MFNAKVERKFNTFLQSCVDSTRMTNDISVTKTIFMLMMKLMKCKDALLSSPLRTKQLEMHILIRNVLAL